MRRRLRSRPASRSVGGRIAFARPKSSTLTVPSGVILMLAGFRSRWTIPFSCAASSASAIWRAIASASSTGSGPRCEPLGERLALDQLQHERARRRCRALLEAVDRADVRMVERREHPRFALEAREPLGIRREDVRQDLDRDVAPELRVARAIDLAHPARAERRKDSVWPRPGVRRCPDAHRPGRAPPPLPVASRETPRLSARAPATSPPPGARRRRRRRRPPGTRPVRAGRGLARRGRALRHAAGVLPSVGHRVSSFELTQQPDLRQAPVAFDSVGRHVERFGGLLDAQPAEAPALDLAFLYVEPPPMPLRADPAPPRPMPVPGTRRALRRARPAVRHRRVCGTGATGRDRRGPAASGEPRSAKKCARSCHRSCRTSVKRRNGSLTSAVACNVCPRRSRPMYRRARRRSSAWTSGVNCSSAPWSPSTHARSNWVTAPGDGIRKSFRLPIRIPTGTRAAQPVADRRCCC